MTFPNVQSKILWKTPANNWTMAVGGVVTDVSAGDQGIILGYMQAAYASPIAAGLMDQAAGTGIIRIGVSAAG